MSKSTKIEDFAKDINSSWRKTTDSILETARLCTKANGQLTKDGRKQLVQLLSFSPSVFSKLVKIGEHALLHQDQVKSLLPPNYTIMYALSQLSDAELQAAVDAGAISPVMSREDVVLLQKRKEGDEAAEGETAKALVLATLKVPVDFDDERKEELEAALEQLQAKFGFSIARPRDADAEAFDRLVHQVDEHMRKEARRFIRLFRSNTLAAAHSHSPAMQKQFWPYSEADIEISNDANWERIEEVLAKIGARDQFARLRDEVLRIHGVSEETIRKHRQLKHDEAMEALRRARKDFQRQKDALWKSPLTPKSFEDFK